MTAESSGSGFRVLLLGDIENESRVLFGHFDNQESHWAVTSQPLPSERVWEALGSGEFDVILLTSDHQEPAALDFVQQFQAHHPPVPLVVVTTQLALRKAALQAGGACWSPDLLTPPILDNILRNAVEPNHRSTSSPAPDTGGDLIRNTAFQAALHGILVLDSNGVVLSHNPAADQMFGYWRGDLEGMSFTDLVQIPETPWTGNGDTILPFETTATRRNGLTFPVEMAIVAVNSSEQARYIAYVSDIRERKRAEHTLHAEEERLRTLSEATNDAVWDWDIMAGGLWWNQGYNKLFGHSMADLPPGLESWTHWIHPDDLERVHHGALDAIRSGSITWSDEYRFQREDGTYAYVLDRGHVIRDDQGRPIRMIGSMQDITDRKRAESALRESEARFRRIVESDMIGVFFWNTDGQITDYNRAFLDIIGYTEADAISGQVNWAGITPPEYAELDARALNQYTTSGICQPYEKEYIRKDGSRIFVLVGGTLLEGSRDHGVAFVLDIDERKRNEVALRHRADFEALVSHLSTSFLNLPSAQVDDGINVALEAIGTFTHVDRAYVFLWSEDGSLMWNSHEWCAPGTECRREFGQNIRTEWFPWLTEQVLALQAVHVPDVTRVQFKSDTERSTVQQRHTKSMVLVPMVYQGKVMGHLGLEATRQPRAWTDDDIAMLRVMAEMAVNALQRKKADEALLRANELLEERVSERTAQLAEANDALRSEIEVRAEAEAKLRRFAAELSQANELAQLARDEAERANQAKNEFLSRMSHELRTPLNAILGFGQLLAADDLPPKRRQGVNHILQAGHHLLDLINEILDISRIESGNLHLSLDITPVWQIVGEAMDLVQPVADKNGIRLVNLIPEVAPWNLIADRQRVRQVLLNLLSNAVKYNRPDGTVTLTAESNSEHHTVRLAVRDTGYGLSEADMARLFIPFERLGAVKTKIEGTGIGLVLSRQLILAMGGRIGVESEVGVGSTFWIELPADPDSLQAAPNPDETAAPGQSTVLYIEDNPINVQLVESILENRTEIRLLTATLARDGLTLARMRLPDLILLDLHLPDGSGEDVLAGLHEKPETSAIPVIVISADINQERRTKVLNLGAQRFLNKPLDVPKFLATVDEILGKS